MYFAIPFVVVFMKGDKSPDQGYKCDMGCKSQIHHGDARCKASGTGMPVQYQAVQDDGNGLQILTSLALREFNACCSITFET